MTFEWHGARAREEFRRECFPCMFPKYNDFMRSVNVTGVDALKYTWL